LLRCPFSSGEGKGEEAVSKKSTFVPKIKLYEEDFYCGYFIACLSHTIRHVVTHVTGATGI
jgi:hypothetical protein